MDDRQKLKNLLEEKLLPELKQFLSQLEMIRRSGASTEEDDAVAAETNELQQTFEGVLRDIETGTMTDTQAREILKELKKYQGS